MLGRLRDPVFASMRPRRVRLGYVMGLREVVPEDVASMRPRRVRLGYASIKRKVIS